MAATSQKHALIRAPELLAPDLLAADAAFMALATQTAATASYGPYPGIVYITDTIGGQDWQGSGVLISPDEVLTASHVVYTQGIGVASNIEVSAGYNYGYAPFGTVAGTTVHYNPVQDAGGMITLYQSESDYAVIHLAQPFYGIAPFAPLADFPGGGATVSGYPGTANGDQVNLTEVVTADPDYTLLDSASLGPGSSGGPVWLTGSDGASYVAGINSSYNGTLGGTGYSVQITPDALARIESWVSQDDGTTPPLAVLDTSNNESWDPTPLAYSGPVANLSDQYINISTDNLNLTASSGNWFLHSGAGEDAIAVHGTTDVLDGGTGSNFLVGGNGFDTFFTDDRAATQSIWDTLVNFHAGDAATVFGVTQAGFNLAWVDGQGAAGYTGLTLHVTAAGKPEASVTLAGLTTAALTDGRLTLSFGTTDGTPYLYIHANP